jgi:hypothetical protein
MIAALTSAPVAVATFTSKLGPRHLRQATRLTQETPLPALSAAHLLNVLHELTSEARRYSLAWYDSNCTDHEAQTSVARMSIARNAVAEILFWRLTGVELPAEVQLERDRAYFRFQVHEIQVVTRELMDETLVWYVFGRRLRSDGTALRQFERVRLEDARMWVTRGTELEPVSLEGLPTRNVSVLPTAEEETC